MLLQTTNWGTRGGHVDDQSLGEIQDCQIKVQPHLPLLSRFRLVLHLQVHQFSCSKPTEQRMATSVPGCNSSSPVPVSTSQGDSDSKIDFVDIGNPGGA